jgi:glucose-6-phosphate 1-dehydrogenase
MIRRFVIFGALGDLTVRYLLPALAELQGAGELPKGFSVTAVARRDLDTNAFRRLVEERIESVWPGMDMAGYGTLLSRTEYRKADVTGREEMARALAPLNEPVVAYLALPPALFGPAVEALAAAGLPAGSRIVLEKPFGEDLASAQALNGLLHGAFPEEAVFRIDHFLGEQTVHNILGLRFGNRVFEPLWNQHHVERVEIIWDETLALEGRASYYDRAGALRDMVQNHLLQLLCIAGMEAPRTLEDRDFRDRKVDVLRAVRRLSPEDVARWTVRGRYGAGRIGDRDVPSYADEEGVDPGRGTETFAQVVLRIDNWRWAGVPFVLRSGKALGRDRREIAVHFKPVPYPVFGQENVPCPNVLRLEMDPDRMALGVNITGPGWPFALACAELERELVPQDLSAYARLLHQVMEGRRELFIRGDEAEESWRIMEPILGAWTQGGVPLLEYPAGSDGPGAPLPGSPDHCGLPTGIERY